MSDIKTVWGASQYYTYTYIDAQGSTVKKGFIIKCKVIGESECKIEALCDLEKRKADKTKDLFRLVTKKQGRELCIEWGELEYQQYERLFI